MAAGRAHQFFANAEFFSDFGRYDVRMTVPSGFIVGATGVEQSRTPAGDRITYRYVEDNVHDFAWTASPEFVERTQRFEHAGLPPVEHAAAAAPRQDAPRRSAFRGRRGHAALLRRVVRPVSLHHAHHCRSGVPERFGRHGVSDDFHRRIAVAVAAQEQRSRVRGDSRDRPPVLAGHGGQQRNRARVARRGHQRVRGFAAAVRGVPAELPGAAVLRRLHSVASTATSR